MADEGTYLYVVEIVFGDKWRDDGLTTVPGDLELGMLLVDVLCQLVHTLRIAVATHKGDAGDLTADLPDEGVDGIGVQREADVLP